MSAFGSLAGTAELDHIHAVVVRFDDGGNGAAFAQRRDVARDHDGAQLGFRRLHAGRV